MRSAALAVSALFVFMVAAEVGAAPAAGGSLLSLPPGVDARAVEAAGLQVLEAFPRAGVVRVAGAPAEVAAKAAALGARAYPEEPVALQLAESRAAVRADDLPLETGALGAGVAVAVVDSGVDEAHPALRDRVVRHVRVSSSGAEAATGDSTGHGTHVAGIVASTGADAPRLRGVAPGASIVAVDISGSFTTTNAIRAFEYIADNAEELNIRVVVNSWGRAKEGARYDPDDPLTRAVHALVDQGLVVVFSAGNHGPGASTLTQEAMDPRVITVGAVDGSGRVERYSGRGPAVGKDGAALEGEKPDLYAPGSSIVSTRAGGGWVTMNGTSMAAPHVAGAAAILLARFPDLGPAEVREALEVTARDGRLDVAAAFDLVATERRVVVEKRVPVAAAGESAVVLGRAVESGAATLVVPPGTSALALTVRWEGVAPEGVVAMLAHAGEPRTRVAGSDGVLQLAADRPEAGTWTLAVAPSGAAGRLAWSAEGVAVVQEVEEANPPAERIGKASVPRDGDGIRLPGGLGKVATLTAALAVSLGVVGIRRRA